MKDKILFIGGAETSRITDEIKQSKNYKKLFELAGSNIGNFVYTMYLKSYLDYDKDNSEHVLLPNELKQIADKKFDKIVLCCANQINPKDKYLLQFAPFLETADVPIILLGLGCQSNAEYSMEFLDNIPEHIEFLNMLKRKGAIIGVRGEFTGRCLEKLGIKSYVIGCPSFYKNGKNIKIKKSNKKNPLVDVSCEWIENKDIWARLIISNNCDIINQTVYELSLYRLSKSCATEEDQQEVYSLFGHEIDVSNESNKFKNRCHIFFDINEWESFIKTRDFYIGPKIHGCLMHLLSGIPALLIVHDSRTREFAELMNIPHIFAKDMKEDLNFVELYKNYDSKNFIKNYKKLFKRYKKFLDYAGLKYRFPSNGIFSRIKNFLTKQN